MHNNPLSLGLIAFLCSISPVSAQRTWIVDAKMGPGAHFADVPQAVARAAAGDQIAMRAGNYSATTVTKGIVLRPVTLNTSVDLQSLTIEGIPARQRFSAKRFSTRGDVRICNCTGPVSLDEVSVARFGGWLRITGSSNVELSSSGPSSAGSLRIDQSRVRILGVGVWGRRVDPFAAHISKSRIELVNASVIGYGGVGDRWSCRVIYPPRIGLIGDYNHFLLFGNSSIRGGHLASGFCPKVVAVSISGGNNVVVRDSKVWSGSLGDKPFSGSPNNRIVERSLPALQAISAPGGFMRLTMTTRANSYAMVLGSLPISRPVSPARTLGRNPGVDPYGAAFGLDLRTLFLADQFALPTGRTEIFYPMTKFLPKSMAGTPLTFQALVFERTGATWSSHSTTVMM